MGKLYDSKYCTVYFDDELLMSEQYWYEETENMSEEDFKDVIQEIATAEGGKLFTALSLLLDNRYFLFSISPELQEWHANYLKPKLLPMTEEGSEVRNAIVVSSDFITQLSIEQTLDEDKDASGVDNIKYFESVEEAKEWLLRID